MFKWTIIIKILFEITIICVINLSAESTYFKQLKYLILLKDTICYFLI